MGYRSLKHCILDLEKNGHLIRISEEIDPNLEIAEIQRRVYEAQGPALLFENIKGSKFPAVCNLFGTLDRCHFMFRDTLPRVKKVMQIKANPPAALKNPFKYLGVPFLAHKALPRKARFSKPVKFAKTTIDQLPLVKSWPDDGGPFITLPQVYTEDPDKPGPMKSNVGMYRVQLMGNQYTPNQQIGLHYQIHRGIGVHHSKTVSKGKKLKVSIFVGGPPSHTLAAVMPLPEGLAEVMFAGMVGNRPFRWFKQDGHTLSADADFCIVGTISGETLPEGPFGDHLGYYSLAHPFPVMEVEAVYHRQGAIWPFTVVGRPPQEDTSFGALIHEITEPVVPSEIPGLHAMHAVDAAGVHPLLLAIGSERYVPFQEEREPQEVLTIANAILGFNQASLAKYLMIIAKEDQPALDIHDMPNYFRHVLERVNWEKDLHFQTRTTMDTLDYSGTGINAGSKVVIAAVGRKRRELATEIPADLRLPEGFSEPNVCLPGVLAIQAPPFTDQNSAESQVDTFTNFMHSAGGLEGFPLVVLVDQAAFTAAKLNNFLWVTFTRSNPSHDVYGVDSFTDHKHWGCRGSLVIDARIKPHHAPPLIEDPAITKRVDALAAKGGPLHGII